MISILSDSMARDHAATVQASAAASRRVREARLARRAARSAAKARRASAATDGSTGDTTQRVASHGDRFGLGIGRTVGHAAARPFTAFQGWLAAGQL